MDDVIYVGSDPVTKDADMDDVVFVSSAPAQREEVTPTRMNLSPPKKRGRSKKVVVVVENKVAGIQFLQTVHT